MTLLSIPPIRPRKPLNFSFILLVIIRATTLFVTAAAESPDSFLHDHDHEHDIIADEKVLSNPTSHPIADPISFALNGKLNSESDQSLGLDVKLEFEPDYYGLTTFANLPYLRGCLNRPSASASASVGVARNEDEGGEYDIVVLGAPFDTVNLHSSLLKFMLFLPFGNIFILSNKMAAPALHAVSS